MAEIHINVGIAALSRGFITHEAFVQALAVLATTKNHTVHDLWVGQGHMTDSQLKTVLDTLGKSSETVVMAGSVPVVPPKPVLPSRPVLPASMDEISTRVGRALKKTLPAGPETAPTAASIVSDGPMSDHTLDVGTDRFAMGTQSDLIGARYRRMSVLGKGGLGEVMACDDLVLQRTVAVKAGHQKGEIDAYSTKVILAREARIISCLEHPNIIPIYDAGTDPTRGPFYVMRQVTETSLEMILHQRKTGEGDPHDYTLNRLLRYFLQVCNAVDYAHHRGVIHCDIKHSRAIIRSAFAAARSGTWRPSRWTRRSSGSTGAPTCSRSA